MIYKLFNEPNQPTMRQVLYNRGLETKEEQDKWINASWNDISSPYAFGKEKVKHALKLMTEAIFDNKEIYVLVDCDADGFTSAAIIMNYIFESYHHIPEVPLIKDRLHYILHTDKQHGLEDCVNQFPDNCLVILPDSSTNDIEQMQVLLNKNCFVVCMDHHEADNYLEDSENLVIINNQISDYPNKDLSAAGVVWQICRAWDQVNQTEFANHYIDLAALGI